MESANPLQQKDIDFLKQEVADLKRTSSDGFMAIHLKLDVMSENFARRDEIKLSFDIRDKQIEEIRDNIKWIARLIVGAVILALLSVIFTHK